MGEDSYFCDYFRGSTPWEPERLAPFISQTVIEDDHGSWVDSRAMYRGDVALQRLQGGQMVLHLEYGGVYGSGAMFQGSGLGGVANRLYGAVRASQVPHRVTRLDVALDFDRPGVAADAFKVALDVAGREKLTVRMMGDWRGDSERVGGRTLYIGSPRSPYFLRLYEKGLHPDQLCMGRPDWFRVEAQIMPEKAPDKLRVAGLSLAENFCSRAWAAEIVAALGAPVVAGVLAGRTKARPDLERAIRAFSTQYGRMLEGVRALCGSDAEVGQYLCLIGPLLQRQGGVHEFRELSDTTSMARFLSVLEARGTGAGGIAAGSGSGVGQGAGGGVAAGVAS